MGCDIHTHLERKVGEKWVMVTDNIGRRTWKDELYVNQRNYQFFAVLAGVRGQGRDPKGLPADVSDSVRYHADEYGSDGHSHSWDTVEEFAKLFHATMHNSEWQEKIAGKAVNWLFEIYEDDPSDYRVVYWFDN